MFTIKDVRNRHQGSVRHRFWNMACGTKLICRLILVLQNCWLNSYGKLQLLVCRIVLMMKSFWERRSKWKTVFANENSISVTDWLYKERVWGITVWWMWIKSERWRINCTRKIGQDSLMVFIDTFWAVNSCRSEEMGKCSGFQNLAA